MRRYEDDLEVARVAFDAVRYRVTTIGEAVESLSLEMREDHTAVPWSLLRADVRAVELAASARPESTVYIPENEITCLALPRGPRCHRDLRWRICGFSAEASAVAARAGPCLLAPDHPRPPLPIGQSRANGQMWASRHPSLNGCTSRRRVVFAWAFFGHT